MAKESDIWFREQTGWYYTTLKGKQIRLSREKEEAKKALHSLLAQEPEPGPSEVKAFPTFRKIADLFISNSIRVNKPTTIRMHKMFLQSFVNRIKGKRVNDLKVHHVSEWLASTPWGQSSSCSARGAILAALNWGVDQGYITSHPLTKLKRGSHKRRERVFSADELKAIRENVKPDFADFVRALELTGARPFSELAHVTADMVDWKEGTITFVEHKNERKGKTRTIYMAPELVTLLMRLAEKYPTGILFRNIKGKIWTSHDATRRLHYITGKLGIPKGTIYAIRHYVITKGLELGMNANTIAELVGNSPVTISRHYDHLSKQKKTMLEAAKKIAN